MSSYSDALDKIREKKQLRELGGYNCIPFKDNFPRLSTYLPGIIKGVYYNVTASSGVGKTQLAKYMFVKTPYDFIKKNPESGLKLKIFYFALEESKEEFMNTMMVSYLAEYHDIHIDVLHLNSMFDNALSNDIIEKIEEGKEYFEELFDCVDVIDSVSHPYGMYLHLRKYSDDNGIHYWTQLQQNVVKRKMITHTEYEALGKEGKKGWKYSHYTQTDENEYRIVITDHISLLQPERMSSLHQTMSNWSANYCRKQITKHWKYVVVNIQQQAAAAESVEHFKANKLEPSLANLGDNKMTARDALVVIGLFAPDRHGLKNYMGYDTAKFGDNFRSLIVLKNRIGKPAKRIGLYFDGAINKFKELPPYKDSVGLEKVHRFIEKQKIKREN